MKGAIIGGTGVYDLGYPVKEKKTIITEYGEAVADILEVDGSEIYFMPRHGSSHSIPPHKINYRANIKALADEGVSCIFGMVTVGSLKDGIGEGSVILMSDFMDFSQGRINTFFEGDDGAVKHVDMGEPYCPHLARRFAEEAEKSGITFFKNGVYVMPNGPRFETRSEIRMYAGLGGTCVGMTNATETPLAKEAGLCYAAVGLVSNYALGIGGENGNLAQHDHKGTVATVKEGVISVMLKVLTSGAVDKRECRCEEAVKK